MAHTVDQQINLDLAAYRRGFALAEASFESFPANVPAMPSQRASALLVCESVSASLLPNLANHLSLR